MKQRKKKKGFTLVELLIVIGISGILMAMAAPKYQGMVDKAAELEQRAHAREALSYIDIYNLNKTEKILDSETLTFATTKITSKEFTNVLTHITFSKDHTIGSIRTFADQGVDLPAAPTKD